ncbi:MAG: spore coat protein U domain-containing protein [Betaproteobacteria bacterium]
MHKRSMDRFALATALFVVLVTGAAPTRAATATAQFFVTVQVDASCVVSAIGNLNFGRIVSPITQFVDTSMEIKLSSCNQSFPPYPVISLSKGKGAGATFAERKMTSTSNSKNTVIYWISLPPPFDSGGGAGPGWGDGSEGSHTYEATPGNAIVVKGIIPILQSPEPGAYTDTVVVTVTF